MRTLAAIWLATLAALISTAPSAAATRYWAFGDSITRAEGLGIILEDVFLVPDHDCLTNPYPVLKCGYHWRVRDALTLAGVAVSDVFNRGVAGENTILGIDRIDNGGEPLEISRCTDSNAGDVVLIMEGTNDVSSILAAVPGVSTDTIKTNLGIIVDLATTKCVHSVLASTIRRLLAGTAMFSKIGDPLELQTGTLATKISALAAAKNRNYVDIWTPLCPDQNCYNLRFWGRFNPADPGHANYSGFSVMAPRFTAAITATPLPGAAGLTGPTGDVTDSTPPFIWSEHAHSDWYYLEVDGGASYGRWHPEEAVCSGGVCTFDPDVVLAAGGHTWRVRTRNLRGVGSWSSSSAFSVWTALPGAAAPTAPTGDGCEAGPGPYTPTYQWNEATQAKSYRIQVTNAATAAVVLDSNYAASGICAGGTCSVTPTTTLSPGAYTWKVLATNPLGSGPWSAGTAFSRFPSALAAPTLVYPLADIFDATSSFPPTYRWNGVTGAEDYDLTVDASTTTHSAGASCSGLACAVTGAAPAVAAHTWSVKAKNRCVIGAATGSQGFSVLACTLPKDKDLPAPGAPIAGTASEAACGELRALNGYVVGSTGAVSFHAGEAVILGNGFQIESGGAFTARSDH